MESSATGEPQMIRQVSMLLTDADTHNQDISNGHPTDTDAHFLVVRYKNVANN